MQSKKYKIAIIATAPFYYHTPLYKRLAQSPEIDLTVFYCSDETLHGKDILRSYHAEGKMAGAKELLAGYKSEFPKNYSPFPSIVHWPFGLMNFDIWKEIKHGKYDAVVLLAWTDVTRWLAFFAALRFGAKVLLMTDSNVLSESSNPKLKHWVKTVLLRFLFSKTAGFLAAGKANEQLYRYFNAPQEKIVNMPFSWGYEDWLKKGEELKKQRDVLRQSLGIAKEEVVALYMGRLSQEKSPMLALDAFYHLQNNNKKLFFVGDGPLRLDLEEKIRRQDIKNVIITGFQSRELLGNFYAAADFFIMPSERDALPLAINEALCFGLPVIASDKVGTTVDLVRDAYNGFVFPINDEQKLTECFRKMITMSSAERELFGARSKELMSQRVSSIDPVRQIVSVLSGRVTAKPSGGKKMLMLSPYIPWPLYGGTMVRIFNLIKVLREQGYEITLLSGRKENEVTLDSPLHQLCDKLYTFDLSFHNSVYFKARSLFSFLPYPILGFQNASLDRELRKILTQDTFDYLFVNLSTLAGALPWDLLKNTKVLLDHPECEELVYEDYFKKGSLPVKIFSWINLVKFQWLHKRVFAYMSAIFCVSDVETEFTKRQVKNTSKVYTIANGVDTEFFHPSNLGNSKKNTIVLCSGMNIKRNIDAAVWFAKSVFPLVCQEVKDAEFLIAGANPTQEVLDLAKTAGITVTGTVPDIRPYYAKGKVFVSPYRFGAGTKLKVLEAMASGVPVVSTSVGCRGINVKNRIHMLIADDEKVFAKNVVEVLKNEVLASTLSENSLQLINEQYTWKSIGEKLHHVIESMQKTPARKSAESRSLIRKLSYNDLFIRTLRALGIRPLARKVYFWWAKPRNGVLEIAIADHACSFYVRSADELRLAESVSGEWGEQGIIEALLSHVSNGDVVYDIGANIGIYTMFLARAAGSAGKVVAFEPEPKSCGRLKDNIQLNNLHNVQVVSKALGSEEKTATLYVGNIIGNFSMLPLAEKNANTESVEVVRGDKLVAEQIIPVPNVIKIDVEGYEYSVLQGLRQTLSHPDCKVICCEVHPEFFPKGVTEELLFAYLSEFGFKEVFLLKKSFGPYHVIMKKLS